MAKINICLNFSCYDCHSPPMKLRHTITMAPPCRAPVADTNTRHMHVRYRVGYWVLGRTQPCLGTRQRRHGLAREGVAVASSSWTMTLVVGVMVVSYLVLEGWEDHVGSDEASDSHWCRRQQLWWMEGWRGITWYWGSYVTGRWKRMQRRRAITFCFLNKLIIYYII